LHPVRVTIGMQTFNTSMKKILSGIILSTLFIALIISGCKKTETVSYIPDIPAVVSLNIVSDVTQTTAQSGGSITYKGKDINAFGVCWSSTNQNPTVADSKTVDVATTKIYLSALTGLTANTIYYVRAYATNADGTGYSAVIKFTTNSIAGKPTGTVTTLAGNTTNGNANGLGASASFDGPASIAFNPVAAKLYIGDTYNNAIRTATTAGLVATLTNSALGFINGPLSSALFYGTKGMAFDAAGNAYVADMGNHVVRKITPAGVVSTYAGSGIAGYLDGTASGARFNNPQSVAVDATGNVYVADRGNNIIRKITTDGLVQSLAGYPTTAGVGYVDATTANAKFNYPVAIAINPAGTKIYVADQKNFAIRVINIADGVVTTLAGSPLFNEVIGTPVGIAFDAAGNLFVADQTGRVLEVTVSGNLYTVAGSLNTAGSANGVGSAARFNSPLGVAVDGAGNVYVTDSNNNLIRKIVVSNQ
jgi:sugar lactone lactonase YvrE